MIVWVSRLKHELADIRDRLFSVRSPGSSSLLGLLEEFGPLLTAEDGSVVPNPYSWDKLVDYVWVDQPV